MRNSLDSNIRIPPANNYVKGIDLSHWNGEVDFQALKNADIKFAMIKATDGLYHVDEQFARNWRESKAHGILRGAYHFFHPAQNPVLQAQHFRAIVAVEDSDLPVALDFEHTDGLGTRARIQAAVAFLSELKKLYQKKPIFYSYPGFINDMGNPSDFYEYPLWIAHYNAHGPSIPPPWNTFLMWQWNEHYRITGVSHDCDMNYFNGTLAQLQELAQTGTV